MFSDYYSLTKSGLVYGNLIPAIGGFAIAARMSGSLSWPALAAMLVGLAFVMASGCVVNNIIDRDIDREMSRTKDRPLVEGRISPRAAAVFAVALGAIGFAALAVWTNWLTVAVAAFGWFAYVFLYSLWSKRQTVYGTAVGSIAGATPPVVGYVAASGRLDLGAALLFIILALWQMPHFFAIGIFREEDYAAAHIPILPVKNGLRTTKIAMLLYIIAFAVAVCLLTVFGYTGPIFLIIALILSIVWLALCVQGFTIDSSNTATDGNKAANKRWARKMFFFSLIVLVVLFAAMAIA